MLFLEKWHIVGKDGKSLRSPWVSISRSWLKVEALVKFKLGNGHWIAFWADRWEGEILFNLLCPRFFRIAFLPNGSVADHLDFALNSWSLNFHRLLKDDGVVEFLELLGLIASRRVSETLDKRTWLLVWNGSFTAKSLTLIYPLLPWTKSCIWPFGKPITPEEWIFWFGQCWLDLWMFPQFCSTKCPQAVFLPLLVLYVVNMAKTLFIFSFCASIQLGVRQNYSLFSTYLGCIVMTLAATFNIFLLDLISTKLLRFFG